MTDAPTIQQNALRVAVLTALTDLIGADLAEARQETLAEFLDLHAAVGVKSLDVNLPGHGKVAGITVTIPEGQPVIVDEDAYAEWVARNHPTRCQDYHVVKAEFVDQVAALHPEWVTTVRRPHKDYTDGLLASVEILTGDDGKTEAFDTFTGEVVPGVTLSRPRAASITVRPVGGKTGEGPQAIAQAWREGRLEGLPALTGPAPAIQTPPV